MSWFKTPKGGDNELAKATKYILYGVLGIGGLYLLARLREYLLVKLEGDKVNETEQTANVIKDTMVDTGSSIVSVVLWLLFIAVLLTVLYLLGKWLLISYYRNLAARGVRYLRILPSSDTKLEVEKVMLMVKSFGGMFRIWKFRIRFGSPWFRLRFAMGPDSDEIGIYLAYPRDKKSSVYDTIRSVYPNAELHELEAAQFPQVQSGGAGGHFTLKSGVKKGLPLASFEQKKESPLGNILNSLRRGTILDLQFSPTSWSALDERSDRVKEELKDKNIADMTPDEKAKRFSLIRRLTGRELSFEVRMSLWSNSPNAISVCRSTATALETALNYDGAIRYWPQKLWNPLRDRNPMPYPWPFTIMTWSGDELANLFHLPPSNHWIYQEPPVGTDSRGYLAHLLPHQAAIQEEDFQEGVKIGLEKHPLAVREVRLPYEQLSKHFLLTGASGMGKSSCAVEMLQSMVDAWVEDPDQQPGFTLIDPAREIISVMENRLRYLESQGKQVPLDKIHHYSLSPDTTHAVALNLLHVEEHDSISQTAEQLAEVILYQSDDSDTWIRAKRLLSMAIHSLLEDNHKHTLLEVDEFLRNTAFRSKVLQNGVDPYVRRFWTKMDESELKIEVEPVLQQMDRLFQDPILRCFYLQKDMSLNIKQFMNEGHIVMFDLYDLNDHELAISVGHLVHSYHRVAKRRTTGSKFHLMMIEEAQLVQLPYFAKILSEDRKYDFGIGWITREIDSFENEDLVQAMKANLGAILSCGQQEGSDKVESLSRGYLPATFLEGLSERNVAVSVRMKRKQKSVTSTFVVECPPPVVYLANGNIANHRNAEKEEAFQWGVNWGLERMKSSPECRPIGEVSSEVGRYMDQSYETNL
ncbi:type IV secretory system conjugative DNA transfer family protein [Risungbinella massiliensis]|uniref:hypothetical protein n=1 Tax=Risungbinella massiliensis TaxID=1329796 RepID=UPI0005CC5477|nr:hypothetical protein [Risungbinella massiliensis]